MDCITKFWVWKFKTSRVISNLLCDRINVITGIYNETTNEILDIVLAKGRQFSALVIQ